MVPELGSDGPSITENDAWRRSFSAISPDHAP